MRPCLSNTSSLSRQTSAKNLQTSSTSDVVQGRTGREGDSDYLLTSLRYSTVLLFKRIMEEDCWS